MSGNRRRLDHPLLVLLARLVPLALALALTATAASAWLASAAGPAAARARALSTSATPITAFARPKVTVSWSASSYAGGGTVPAYVIRRYNAITGAGQPGTNSCSGLVAALSCTENNAPAGTWRYTVTSAAGGWRGIESAMSVPIVIG